MSDDVRSVAIIAHRLATLTATGVDRYFRELVLAMARRSDIEVCLSSPPERAAPDWVPPGVAVRPMGGPRKAVLLGWCAAGWPRIDRTVGEMDLVHVAVPAFPVPTRRPVVYTVFDLMTRLHPDWYGRVERWAYDRAFRALEGAGAIIATTSWTARLLETLPWVDPAAIIVIPAGVSDRFFLPRSRAEVEFACQATGVSVGAFDLAVGQVNDRKNITILIEALTAAKAPRPLVVAGSFGRGGEAVVEFARARGVHDLVTFTGYVDEDRLAGLLAGARVLLHPSRHEGFGFTPLEAMASGTPAVVADASALPETAGDAALRCDPDDVEAWADAIDRLGDDAVRDDLVGRGREHAERFRWPDVAERTLEVYRSVSGR